MPFPSSYHLQSELHRPAGARKDLVLGSRFLKMCLVAIKNTISGDWGLDTFLNACYCSIRSFVHDMCLLTERPLFFRDQTRRL